jgi:hypothetical protein
MGSKLAGRGVLAEVELVELGGVDDLAGVVDLAGLTGTDGEERGTVTVALTRPAWRPPGRCNAISATIATATPIDARSTPTSRSIRQRFGESGA